MDEPLIPIGGAPPAFLPKLGGPGSLGPFLSEFSRKTAGEPADVLRAMRVRPIAARDLRPGHQAAVFRYQQRVEVAGVLATAALSS